MAQHGHVEVAVGGERERARDRRRRHVQHVRREPCRRLAVQRAALVDAEAVLLVDDGDREPVERHRALDQRVGADQQLELAARELPEQVGAAAGGGRSGQQRGLQQLAGHQRLQRGEVLLGQRLGRRHQRRLGALLDGPQHRVERDDGLAGADLAHQQPLHRAAGREVAVDRGHRPVLVVGRGERERIGQPAPGQRAGRVERLGAGGLAAPGAAAQQHDLQQQQLLEREPHARGLLVAEVRGAERRRPVRPAAGGAQARRQRLDDVRERGAVLAHERGDLGRREPVGRRIGRHVAAGADLLAGLGVVLDAEAIAALVLALQHQPRAGAVLALQPRLVEERRLHDPRLVGDGRLHQRLHPAPAHGPRCDRAHLDRDGGDLVGRELGDRARLRAVAREMLEQVADRLQPESLGALARRAPGFSSSGAASRSARGKRGPPAARSASAPSGAEEAKASGGAGGMAAPILAAGPVGPRGRPRSAHSAAISHQ